MVLCTTFCTFTVYSLTPFRVCQVRYQVHVLLVLLRLQSLHQFNTNIVIETTYGASVAPIARP